MKRIVTITFNPALDLSTKVAALVPEKKMRCAAPVLELGGGGINVARAIKKLGGEATAVFWSGGYAGREIFHRLGQEGVGALALPVAGECRENIAVYDEATGQQYRFVMPGPQVTAAELENGLKLIEDIGAIDYLVASGSLAPGMPPDTFARLGRLAQNIDAKYIIDTRGEALALAIHAGVYLAKPNISELATLAGLTEVLNNEVAAVAENLIHTTGCGALMVSMGAAGAMLVTPQQITRFVPPPVTIQSTVGAGDSMLGGIVWSLAQNKTLPQAARYGVACGTAATLNAGTALCNAADAADIYRRITLQTITTIR
jgi:6-phosphofructokinase 2